MAKAPKKDEPPKEANEVVEMDRVDYGGMPAELTLDILPLGTGTNLPEQEPDVVAQSDARQLDTTGEPFSEAEQVAMQAQRDYFASLASLPSLNAPPEIEPLVGSPKPFTRPMGLKITRTDW